MVDERLAKALFVWLLLYLWTHRSRKAEFQGMCTAVVVDDNDDGGDDDDDI